MSKQTAVEWLYSELSKNHISNNSIKSRIYKESEIWKQAKAMEKEQIEEAFEAGDGDAYNLEEAKTWAKQYYNETYGGDK
jgi:hypothetical protein